MPKAKPRYLSGSIPTWRSTFGCTMPQPAISSQRPLSGPLMKATSISAEGSVNGKERRAEAHLQVVAFEKAAQEVADDAFQVGKADVLANPQPFDLMEHRRMGGVRIDAIDAARRDDADFRHRFRVQHIWLRAPACSAPGSGWYACAAGCPRPPCRLRPEQVEGVVHRTRRVILRRIQCCEILEVGFDFRAVGDFETDRAEQRFDAFQGARDRVQSAAVFAAAGQGDVERFFGQPGFKRQMPDGFAASVERRLDGFLGAVDCCAGGFRSSGESLAIPLSSSVILPLLPRKRALICSSASGSSVAAKAAARLVLFDRGSA
jgi:hypothetical protein